MILRRYLFSTFVVFVKILYGYFIIFELLCLPLPPYILFSWLIVGLRSSLVIFSTVSISYDLNCSKYLFQSNIEYYVLISNFLDIFLSVLLHDLLYGLHFWFIFFALSLSGNLLILIVWTGSSIKDVNIFYLIFLYLPFLYQCERQQLHAQVLFLLH